MSDPTYETLNAQLDDVMRGIVALQTENDRLARKVAAARLRLTAIAACADEAAAPEWMIAEAERAIDELDTP